MPLNPPIADWNGRVAWIVGASTGIGRATAALLHARGAQVVVSARSTAALDSFVAEHPGAVALPCDVTDRAAMAEATERATALWGRLDLVVYCAGFYQPMRATDFDLDVALRHIEVNQIGALNLLGALLPRLIAQKSGHLSLVGSVAGYRGLPKSLGYGPTKAALINLAQTLYLDLHPPGIGVSIVNPGFVETPLTAGNDFTMPALITPEQAAVEILKGWAAGDFEIHFPKRFTLWLKFLRHLGDGLYFRAIRRATGL